jgi:hypothetical protein
MGRSVCVCVCVCARARACVCVHVMRAWVSPITFSCSNTASVDVARTLLTRFLSASSWDRSAYPRTGQLSVAGQHGQDSQNTNISTAGYCKRTESAMMLVKKVFEKPTSSQVVSQN